MRDFKLYKVSTLGGISLTQLPICTRLCNRRKPSLQEIGSEGEDHIRGADIEERQSRLTEHIFGCLHQSGSRLEHSQCPKTQWGGRADGFGQVGNEVEEMVRGHAHQEGNLTWLVLGQGIGHHLGSCIPIQFIRLDFPSLLTLKWIGNPVGII